MVGPAGYEMAGESESGWLITWTCYGTWLPGDRRGYVSDTFHPDGSRAPKHNVPGTPYTANDEYTYQRAQRRQKGATVRLKRDEAVVVAEGLVSAANQRGWWILRAAAMWNHVHVVVVDGPRDGPGVRRALKGPTQARLSQHAGGPRRWWTRGGSDRYLPDERAIQAAVQYVARQHGILAEVIDMEVVKHA